MIERGGHVIYACDCCHFVFERTGETHACPDCGKPAVREATDKEKEEYIEYRSAGKRGEAEIDR